jgi:hypothetical protein
MLMLAFIASKVNRVAQGTSERERDREGEREREIGKESEREIGKESERER